MEKSLKSPEYARLIELLVAVRHAAGASQQVLAKKLDRQQSFIAKYEGGERRIDGRPPEGEHDGERRQGGADTTRSGCHAESP